MGHTWLTENVRWSRRITVDVAWVTHGLQRMSDGHRWIAVNDTWVTPSLQRISHGHTRFTVDVT